MKITCRGGGRMSGCSLHEAFPDTAKQSGKIAKREEREKSKRCTGPALAFLKAGNDEEMNLDPDRQAQRKLPPSEKLQGREGFQNKLIREKFASQDAENKEYMPIKATDCDKQDRELVKSLISQQVDDVIGEKSRRSLPRATESPAQTPDFTKTMYGDPVPSYFGKSVSEDGFADYSSSMTDNPGYSVQGSTFSPSSNPMGADKPSGIPLPPAFKEDIWKPLSPSGANTSYFNIPSPSPPSLPPEPSPLPPSSFTPDCCKVLQKDSKEREELYASFTKEEKRNLLNKIDTIFEKLEELNYKSNEHSNAELTLFILSGLFLMFGLESVRKFR